MSKIGFVGLGLMGNPMSKNLINAGHDLTVWNRTAQRMDELVAAGATSAGSAKEAARGSDLTITMVGDSADVEQVVLGPAGVMEGAEPGSVVIDMSTISPSVTRTVASELRKKGVEMLDAPVSGGVIGAVGGTLSIMVGGDRSVFEGSTTVLEAMGTRITYCGESGMGQVTKLANQIVGTGTIAAVCEGLLYAARAGGDPEAIIGALTGGAANSWMLENLGPKIYERDFAPGFMVDLAQKDIRLVLESAAELDLPLVLIPLVTQIFRSAQRMGMGKEGTQAYVKVLERLADFEASGDGVPIA